MVRVSIIAGESNSGKSTLISTLNPKETFIINCMNKPLPFRGSSKMYSSENRNISRSFQDDGVLWEKTVMLMKDISANRPEIKHLIIDDAGHIMGGENMKVATDKGWDKFTVIAQHMYFVLNTAMGLRDDLDVVFMFHSKEEQLDALNRVVSLDLPGRMIEERFHPQRICTVVAYTEVIFNEDGTETYNLVVNKTPKYRMAKTPEGMFEDKRIPQDLNLFLTTIRNYYEEEK